jgi:hypothetical protein
MRTITVKKAKTSDKQNGNDAAAKKYRGIFFGNLGDVPSASADIRGNTITCPSAESAGCGILVGGSGQEIDIRDNRIGQAKESA